MRLSWKCLWIVILACLAVLSTAFTTFGAIHDDANAAIAGAEAKILVCYEAILGAERAGGNVTELALALNEGGDLLSKAYVAYKSGDFYAAVELALDSQDRVSGLEVQAEALEQSASDAGRFDFNLNVVASLLGTCAVFYGGSVIWLALKRKGESG